MTMTLIESVTVGSGGASSIEFTSIPQDGTDLVVLFSGRGTTTSTGAKLSFNGVTTDLSFLFLQGNGSSPANGPIQAGLTPFLVGVSDSTSNTFSNSSAYVANYTSATSKSVSGDAVNENNGTTAIQRITAGVWADSAAITSVEIVAFASFVENTTASLYKITKGSDGIVTTS